MGKVQTFPKLFKRAASGKVVEWTIHVEDRGTEAAVIIRHGEQGGAVQESVDVISQGVNIGKKNETTYLEQAIAEASSRWTKQRDRKRYDESLEQIDTKKQAAPMLAHPYEKHASKIDWVHPVFYQPKLDGFRCLATRHSDGRVTLRSREGKPIESMTHIVEILESVQWPKELHTLDGELYTHGVPFQTIASRIKRKQAGSEKIGYTLYDTVHAAPIFDRLGMIECFSGLDPVDTIQSCEVDKSDDIEVYHSQFVEFGYEGVIVRHSMTGYEAGKRSHNLLKYKHFDDDEFLILSVSKGKGPYSDKAIFTCKVGDNQTFNVTAPGTLEDKAAALASAEKCVGKLLTVKYQGFSDEGIPRFPVAKAIR